ncbi:MAG: hypothetical protein ACODAB_04990 [Gemmatimonadota bacterium]
MIDAGRRVLVSLALDAAAQRRAALLAGFVPSTGAEPDVQSADVGPGRRETLSFTPDTRGLLQIRVRMASESDVGTLVVEVDGVREHEARISGTTTLTFAVVS